MFFWTICFLFLSLFFFSTTLLEELGRSRVDVGVTSGFSPVLIITPDVTRHTAVRPSPFLPSAFSL